MWTYPLTLIILTYYVAEYFCHITGSRKCSLTIVVNKHLQFTFKYLRNFSPPHVLNTQYQNISVLKVSRKNGNNLVCRSRHSYFPIQYAHAFYQSTFKVIKADIQIIILIQHPQYHIF